MLKTKNLLIIFALSLFLLPLGSYAGVLDNTRGKILLQVEENGEAWFVNVTDNNRYYMGRPTDAFNLMHRLGVGISNQDLNKIPVADANLSGGHDIDNDGLDQVAEDAFGTNNSVWDTDGDGYDDKTEILNGYDPLSAGQVKRHNLNFAAKHKGKIFIQVEQHGEAWYVNPDDNKRYFLGRPTDAFNLMRSLGLGITNADLNQIPTKDLPALDFVFDSSMVRFTSQADFSNYLANNPTESMLSGLNFLNPPRPVPDMIFLDEDQGVDLFLSQPSAESAAPKDVSETNVQVSGVDEPDIVKTDGQELYFSPYSYYSYSYGNNKTKLIDVWPADDLKVDSEIDQNGLMLLHNDVLMIMQYNNIYGYDVSDETNPVKLWQIEIVNNAYYETARLYNGQLYLLTKSYLNNYAPCPFRPVISNDREIFISCSEIYHPVAQAPVDITYTLMKINPVNGDIVDRSAFVGSADNSVVYMSTNSIYVSYVYQGDFVRFVYNFLLANKDLFDQALIDRVSNVINLDISQRAKIVELEEIFKEYARGLSSEEQTYLRNEINNRLDDYLKEHLRELEQTGIVKVNLSDLDVTDQGSVPGVLLNQFSLDEYQGNLRVATSVGTGWFSRRFIGTSDTVNDVYVLNSNLAQIGLVKDLGLGERIYSARFVGDKGYLVTFRQIDPFYVLDLASPTNPKVAGELKIPGFSSYLHPISDDLVLGIGQEGSDVKLSLFDVSDPAKPTEVSKYLLDEYWTQVANDHHAFLLDSRYNVFFLPAGQTGYIFSYENNELSLTATTAQNNAQRAIYIDNFMYIIGLDKITVFNEDNWQKVSELDPDFESQPVYYLE